jgi:hypothetical protein
LIEGAVVLEGLKRASWDIEKDHRIILPASFGGMPLLLIISA